MPLTGLLGTDASQPGALSPGAGLASGSFMIAPASVRAGRFSVVLTLTGTDTTWDGSTVFTVTGAGAKVSQSVTDAAHAGVTINADPAGGVITVSDGTQSALTTGDVASIARTPSAAYPGVAGITLTLSGTGTDWQDVTPSWSVVSGNASITANSVSSNTAATLTVTFGASSLVTFSDGLTTFTVSVASASMTADPISVATGSVTAVTLTGTNTLWAQVGPSLSVIGLSGAALDAPTINSNTQLSVNVHTPASGGGLTITDATTGASTTLTVVAQVSIVKQAPFFTTDTVTTAGYQLYRWASGVLTAAGFHVTSGISAIPSITNGFVTQITVTPDADGGFRGLIVWDTGGGSPVYVADELFLPPPAASVAATVDEIAIAAAVWANGARTLTTALPTAADIRQEIDSNSTRLSAIAGYLDTEIAAIKAKTDNLPNDPAGLANLMATVIETGVSFKEAIRAMAAVTAGDFDGTAFKALGNSGTTRITPTITETTRENVLSL